METIPVRIYCPREPWAQRTVYVLKSVSNDGAEVYFCNGCDFANGNTGCIACIKDMNRRFNEQEDIPPQPFLPFVFRE